MQRKMLDRTLKQMGRAAGVFSVQPEAVYDEKGRLVKLMLWFRFSETSLAAIAHDWVQWRGSRSVLKCARDMARSVRGSAAFYRRSPKAWGVI